MQYRPYYNDGSMYPPQQYPYTQHPNYPYIQQNGPQPFQQTPYEQFAKPQQPLYWDPTQTLHGSQPQQGSNPGGGIKAYFQDQDGQVDFDKMLSTVGQLASTYHQVSPIVKQFGSIIKIFK
jgi:hypothetical protein